MIRILSTVLFYLIGIDSFTQNILLSENFENNSLPSPP